MFTGIIETMGVLRRIASSGKGTSMEVESDRPLEGIKIGDSVSVSGACLTMTRGDARRFWVDVSPETLSRTVLKTARAGDRVNLERAMRLSDRLDGHLVLGHVDGIAGIREKRNLENAIIVAFSADRSLTRYMIDKGSVAVDGISLTINRLYDEGFEVSIIPHTAKVTTIGFKKTGDPVNIETDMIGKYVQRFMGDKREAESAKPGIDISFLAKNGFI